MGLGRPTHCLAPGSHKPLPLHHRFPFYYEIKMAFVLWLLSPYTKGASLLYRKFVHPSLSRHEKVPLGEVKEACRRVCQWGGCVREKALCLRFRELRCLDLISCSTAVLLWDCDRGWLSSAAWMTHMNDL